MRIRLLLIAALIAGSAHARDGYPSSETEKTLIDLFLLGFMSASACPDLNVDLDRIEELRKLSGLPDTTFRFFGPNGAYVAAQINELSPIFEKTPTLACASVYRRLGPDSAVQPPIVRKKR